MHRFLQSAVFCQIIDHTLQPLFLVLELLQVLVDQISQVTLVNLKRHDKNIFFGHVLSILIMVLQLLQKEGFSIILDLLAFHDLLLLHVLDTGSHAIEDISSEILEVELFTKLVEIINLLLLFCYLHLDFPFVLLIAE